MFNKALNYKHDDFCTEKSDANGICGFPFDRIPPTVNSSDWYQGANTTNNTWITWLKLHCMHIKR
jgi:hypothetical protein